MFKQEGEGNLGMRQRRREIGGRFLLPLASRFSHTQDPPFFSLRTPTTQAILSKVKNFK